MRLGLVLLVAAVAVLGTAGSAAADVCVNVMAGVHALISFSSDPLHYIVAPGFIADAFTTCPP